MASIVVQNSITTRAGTTLVTMWLWKFNGKSSLSTPSLKLMTLSRHSPLE